MKGFKSKYEEKYKKGVMVKADCLPKKPMPHMTKDSKIIGIELKAAGVGYIGEKRVEYQDLRIFVGIEK